MKVFTPLPATAIEWPLLKIATVLNKVLYVRWASSSFRFLL